LTAVVDGADTDAGPEATTTMPLLAAALMVAKATQIPIELGPGGLEAVNRASDPLAMLSESAGFHSVSVHLEGDWWRRDQGPLLALMGPERKPVALLSVKPGIYDAVDPVTRRRLRVTADVAAQVARDARSFVRLLPRHPVSFRDVWANGFHGLGADLRRLGLAMGLAGSVAFSMPLIIEQIIGTAVPEADRGALAILVGMMIAIALAGAGFSIVQSLALLRIEGRASARTQLAVFARMLRLPTDFFRNFTAGDLSVRVRGVEEMRQLLSDNMLFVIMATVNGSFSFALMLYYEVRLALTVAAVALMVGLLSYFFGGRVVRLQRALLNIRGDVESDVIQYLGGITELRTNNAERQAFSRWSAKFAASQKHAYEIGLFSNAGQATNAAFSFASVLAIVIAIGLVTDQLLAFIRVDLSWSSLAGDGIEKAMNPAQFMAFYAAFGQFSLAVNQIVQSGLNLTALAPAYDRLRPLLEAEEEHQEGDQDPGVLRGDIDVRGVQFRYAPGQPLVLKGVSLSARAGQFVAVVGPSGAGKSSLMRLLLGFDNPEAGSVFLDGQDLRHLSKRAVRRNFGVVLQTVRVMTGTILENITNGTDLSEEDAWWAAEQVGFAEDIRRMPDGLYTMLSDGGATLSGGQCQRLMLARAIIRRPRIMLLDEATSALDNEVQSIVTEALDKLQCTRIVIAHRLSTIANADVIYVIDAGQVVEHGSYDALMAQGGVFSDLMKRQLTEGAKA
jgi:NHLM bacteriocin system ABC transporter ATP-binding protein